jgi:formate dehydrogenase major subunit
MEPTMSDVLKSPAGGCGSGNCACKSQAQAQRSTQPRSPFDDTDYGTPLRHADVDVTLEIDGQAVTVPAGTSVMRAAIEAGGVSSRSKASAVIRPRARHPWKRA